MALFKAYVLQRQASAPTHLPNVTVSAPSTAAAAVPTVTGPPAATQSRPLTAASVKAHLERRKHLSPSQLAQKIMSPAKPCQPSLSESAARRRQEMVTVASQAEEQLPQTTAASRGPAPDPAPPALWTPSLVFQPPADLPAHWKEQLPSFQQDWIRKSLFRADTKTGKPELMPHPNFWWYPPQPPTIFTQPPASPDVFFCRPLFLWMPLKMWLIPLACLQPACNNHSLTAADFYRTVRKVLDIDGWYDMATEYLECKGCKKKYPAWSEDILGQLDMGHRRKFPATLTYQHINDNSNVQ
ncbi:hypothetical protein CRENBAI_007038 [Crenichthys baileyi]|uniref:DUF6729 domain-containing protein n=1 Tax=Crenichthys baileyi TaxID=28760 RepID=A0AAV9RU17_9TELE